MNFILQKGTCGFGTRSRNFLCQRYDGQVATPSHCAGLNLPHEAVSSTFDFYLEELVKW